MRPVRDLTKFTGASQLRTFPTNEAAERFLRTLGYSQLGRGQWVKHERGGKSSATVEPRGTEFLVSMRWRDQAH